MNANTWYQQTVSSYGGDLPPPPLRTKQDQEEVDSFFTGNLDPKIFQSWVDEKTWEGRLLLYLKYFLYGSVIAYAGYWIYKRFPYHK